MEEEPGGSTERSERDLKSEVKQYQTQLKQERLQREKLETDRDKYFRLYESAYAQIKAYEKGETVEAINLPPVSKIPPFHEVAHQVKQELEAPKMQRQMLTSELNKVKNAFQTYAQTIRSRDQALRVASLKTDSLTEEVRNLQQRLDKATSKIRFWRSKADDEGVEQTELLAKLRQRVKEIEASKPRSRHSLQDQYEESIEDKLNNAQGTIAILADENQRLTCKLQEKESNMRAISKANRDLEDMNLDLAKRMASFPQQTHDKQITETRKTIGKSQTMETYFQMELVRKAQQLNEKQHSIDELEREIDSMHTDRMHMRKASFQQLIPTEVQANNDGLLLKIEKQKRTVEKLNTQLEHSKRINATMVTLLQVKNEKLTLAGKAPRASEPKVAVAMSNINKQEKALMKTLQKQMSKVKAKSRSNSIDKPN